jgi:hypothetical protein
MTSITLRNGTLLKKHTQNHKKQTTTTTKHKWESYKSTECCFKLSSCKIEKIRIPIEIPKRENRKF